MFSTPVQTETFLRSDIHNLLRALDSANRELAENLPIHEVTVYRKGYLAALQSVAQGVGIELIPIDNHDFRSETENLGNNGSGMFTMDRHARVSSDGRQDF